MSQFPREINTVTKDVRQVNILFALCYPSTYRAGMSGLAMHLFYSALNARQDTSCERYFRFDTPSPVRSLESGRGLRDNHIVGFSLTYEIDILHLVQMLEMAGIPAFASDRECDDPIVIIGGPAVSANPLPFSRFADAFVIGEGDLVIHDIVDTVGEDKSRNDIIDAIADIEGVYVPHRSEGPVRRLKIDNIDHIFHPTRQIVADVPDGSRHQPIFGRALLVEVTRGCGHACKFCLIGHIPGPRRARSLERLQSIIQRGIAETPVKKLALIGSSLGDMPRLQELIDWIVGAGLQLSVPSLRADTVTQELVSSIAKGGQRTLTIAPETGTEELRRRVGKGIRDDQIERAIDMAESAGMHAVKLYFIVGLPSEQESDVAAIAEMVRSLAERHRIRITVGVNPFVPKAHTRFEREAQPSLEVIRAKIRLVEERLRSVPRVIFEGLDPREARVQAALSMGDESLSEVILLASRYGGLGGWRRAERESGIAFFSVASDTSRREGDLPWSFIVD